MRSLGENLAQFETASSAYEARFGFPFIVCVRRLTPRFVLRNLTNRLANTRGTGTRGRPDRDRLHHPPAFRGPGHRTRHAIYRRAFFHPCARYSAGQGGRRRPIRLLREDVPIAEAITDRDGRAGSALLPEGPLRIGRYELRFDVEDYFAGWPNVTDPPWYDVIPVRFVISEPEGHYHIPLLLGAWTYTTYRGS